MLSSTQDSDVAIVKQWIEDNVVEICLDMFGGHLEMMEEMLYGFFPELCTVRRKARPRVKCFNDTYWMKLLSDPDVLDINTREGKEFRNKFRLPAPFFIQWLIPKVKEANVFRLKKKKDGSDRAEMIPVEIKVMIATRMLGRGLMIDDAAEMSCVGNSTVDSIFHTFCTNFPKHFYKDFIYVPSAGDELQKIVEVYSKLGLPGCIGSMDCTHIRWWSCPAYARQASTGKEGKPTLAFQLLVDHSRRILHVSKAFVGAMNDMNICDVSTLVITFLYFTRLY